MPQDRPGRNGGTLKSKAKGDPGGPGRPKSIIPELELATGIEVKVTLTKSQVYDIIRWLFELDEDQLQNVATGKTQPIFVRTIATAMLADLRSEKVDTLEKYMDRFFGKSASMVSIQQQESAGQPKGSVTNLAGINIVVVGGIKDPIQSEDLLPED